MPGASDPVDRDFRESQIRMEGKLDRIGDAMQRHTEDMRDIRQTVHAHGNRIGVLEADKSLREGKVMGVVTSGRVIAWLVGIMLGSGGAITVLELVK